MKPEELQLGDIVATTPSGMPIKVVAIHRKKVAYHACTDRFSWVRLGLLQPIPLTPEILEKNFPKEDFVYWEENKGSELYHIHIERCFQEFNGFLKFVHELQHALRLCGVRKEIKL